MIKSCVNCFKEFDFYYYSFLCPFCIYLNPLEDSNYFYYLGVEPGFILDSALLKKQYLSKMALLHPDNYVAKSKEEQSNSIMHSSYLNNGFDTLRKQLTRFSYLYKTVHGEEIIDNEGVVEDPELIMQFMEYHENLHNARTNMQVKELQNMLENQESEVTQKIISQGINMPKNTYKDLYKQLVYIDRILYRIKQKKF